MINSKIIYLLLVIILFSCSNKGDTNLLRTDQYKSPEFTRNDIPITIGTYWKYTQAEIQSNTGKVISFTITLKIKKVEYGNSDTLKIYYELKTLSLSTNEDVIIDSAIGILTNSSYTYKSIRYKNETDFHLGNYRLEFPIVFKKYWVSINPLDTLHVQTYADKIAGSPLMYSQVFYLYSFYSKYPDYREQEIYLSKGIGIVLKGFHKENYDKEFDNQKSSYTLVEYKVEQ